MTTFLDGPAKGQNLALKQSPELLTVVVDEKGKWDALDCPEDSIRPGEKSFVYRLKEKQGMVHINRGKNGSGFYAIAQYEFLSA